MNKNLFYLIALLLIAGGVYYNQEYKQGQEIKIQDYVILEADETRAAAYAAKMAEKQAEEEKSFIDTKANSFIENSGANDVFKASVDVEAEMNQ